MTDSPGAFSQPQLDEALGAMGSRLGLDTRDARLIKFTHNATYLLPREQLVARLIGSRAMLHRADKIVRVAHWLAGHDFPAVRLVDGLDQPVHHHGFVATFWHAVPTNGAEPTSTDLGHVLRRFHTLPPPAPPFRAWDPMDDVRRRLRHADGLAAGDLAFLHAQADEIDDQLRRLGPALPTGPIHGDAFVGNLIPSLDGPVLCDFDSTSTGAREWDLTPITLAHLRFGRPVTDHRNLAAAYGFDVTAWDGFPLLRRVRELRLVTSVVPVLRSNPRIVEQFKVRLDSLREADPDRQWEPY